MQNIQISNRLYKRLQSYQKEVNDIRRKNKLKAENISFTIRWILDFAEPQIEALRQRANRELRSD